MDTLFFGSPLVLRSTDAQALYVPGQLRVAQSALFGVNVKVPFLNSRRRKFTDTFTIGQASNNVYYTSFLRPTLAAQNAGVRTNETATVFIQGAPQGTARNSIGTRAALIVSQGPSQFRNDVSLLGGLSVSKQVTASGASTSVARIDSLNVGTFSAVTGLSVTTGVLRATAFANIVSSTQGAVGTVNAGTLLITNDFSINETTGQLLCINMTAPVVRANTLPALLQVTSVNSLSINNSSSANANNVGLTHTNAGTMTVRGHAALAKQSFVNTVVLNRTAGTGFSNYMSLWFNQTAQTVLLNGSGNATGCTIYNDNHHNFAVAGPVCIQATSALLYNFTPTVSTAAQVRLAALGLGHQSDTTNFEYLNIATATNAFSFRAVNAGTGTNRSLAIGTQNYPQQISLQTAGNYVVMTQGPLVASTVYMGNATSGSNGLFVDWARFIAYARDDNAFNAQTSFLNNGNGRNLWLFNNSVSRNLALSSRILGLQSGNTATRQDVSIVLTSLAGTMQNASASPFEKLTLGSRSTSQFLISPTNAGVGVLRPLTLGFTATSMFLQTSGGIDLLTGQARGSLALAGTSDPTVNIAGGLGVAKAVLAASCSASSRVVSSPLGSLAQTSAFAIANNQTSPAIVSGLSFPSSVRSAVLQVAIAINATTPLYTLQRLFLVNNLVPKSVLYSDPGLLQTGSHLGSVSAWGSLSQTSAAYQGSLYLNQTDGTYVRFTSGSPTVDGDFMTLPNPLTINVANDGFTLFIRCRFRGVTPSAWERFFDFSNAGSAAYAMYRSNQTSNIDFIAYNTTSPTFSGDYMPITGAITQDVFAGYLIRYRASDQRMQFYKDNTLLVTQTWGAALNNVTFTASYLGRDNFTTNTSNFDVSHFAIFDQHLADADVTDLFNLNAWDVTTVSTGSSSGVTLYVWSNGQVAYTSTNVSGFTSGTLRYTAVAV